METYISDYMDRLDALHDEINHALEDLPQDALDWVPGPGMNSLAVLVAHTAGSGRFWIGDIAAGEPSGRDRPSEFQTLGVGLTTLKDRLAASLAYAHDFLPTLEFNDLSSIRTSPLDSRQITVGWALNHALEHTALHTGHIQLTRQLWDLHRAQN